MAKRSPILGYNHNIRYRGLVFHVQTEDSGVLAPHVFTHLFHGGVILSTRKLVYDAGASEDVIRSLMQAQHKAVLKELRRGNFDDKIDEYLGADPKLLPRGSGESMPEISLSGDEVGEAATTEPIPVMDLPVEVGPPEASPGEAVPEVAAEGETTPIDLSQAELVTPPRPSPPPLPGIPRPKTQPVPPVVTFTDEGASTLAAAAAAAAAAVAQASTASAAVPAAAERRDSGRVAITAASLPPPPARGSTSPRISAVAPPRPAITPPVVVARDLDTAGSDSAEIYSPPPPSAEPPPGLAESPGGYSVRRRDADPSRAPSPRPGTPVAGPAARATPPTHSLSAAASARPVAPPASPAAPVAPPAASTSPRARPTGGVVMSRPAVIVGAPRTSPPPNKPRPPSSDDRKGFGQGLISEKSLDEVILAYLSEDSADE